MQRGLPRGEYGLIICIMAAVFGAAMECARCRNAGFFISGGCGEQRESVPGVRSPVRNGITSSVLSRASPCWRPGSGEWKCS